MLAETKGLIFSRVRGCETLKIYGYASKGSPGLQILGLGGQGQLVREKIWFITKKAEIKVPMKKFMICVEDPLGLKDLVPGELRWLELPLLMFFWQLLSVLPLLDLKNVMSSGRVTPGGRVYLPPLENILQERVETEKGILIHLEKLDYDSSQILSIDSLFDFTNVLSFEVDKELIKERGFSLVHQSP